MVLQNKKKLKFVVHVGVCVCKSVMTVVINWIDMVVTVIDYCRHALCCTHVANAYALPGPIQSTVLEPGAICVLPASLTMCILRP